MHVIPQSAVGATEPTEVEFPQSTETLVMCG